MKDSWEVKPAHVTRAELGKQRREESLHQLGFEGPILETRSESGKRSSREFGCGYEEGKEV